MNASISRWDKARQAIVEAKTVDEVKDIRDKAEAMRMYAKQAGESLAVQNDIAEIKLRAERRVGELLKDMPKNTGAKGNPGGRGATVVRSHDETAQPKLSDIGISKSQSSRFQQVADLPEDEFEQHIQQTKESGNELTTTGVSRKSKEHVRQEKRETNKKQVVTTTDILTHVDGKTYSTIVIDPPWDWGDEGDHDQLGRSRPTYDTMSKKELAEIPITQLAKENAHLYLWITNRSLPKGFELLDAWGFRYITCLTWCKPSFGMGNYFRGSTEQILFGVRGSLSLLRHDVGTWFTADRQQGHSVKPDAFYDLIETCSPSPWLDIFARKERPDWTVWGAELS